MSPFSSENTPSVLIMQEMIDPTPLMIGRYLYKRGERPPPAFHPGKPSQWLARLESQQSVPSPSCNDDPCCFTLVIRCSLLSISHKETQIAQNLIQVSISSFSFYTSSPHFVGSLRYFWPQVYTFPFNIIIFTYTVLINHH